jgi:hypothetical protein
VGAVYQGTLAPACQQQHQAFLDDGVPVDGGRQAGAQLLHQVTLPSQPGDVVIVLLGEGGPHGVAGQLLHAIRDHNRAEHACSWLRRQQQW